MSFMVELSVLVPAAGRGSRAGLAYPKTLFPVNGIPILHRLLSVLAPYDRCPTIVVSAEGESLIRSSLEQVSLKAHLVLQPEPRGMGDAVLCFDLSPAAEVAEHILLAWGDLAFLQPETVSKLVDAHLTSNNDFSFATCLVDEAYTVVSRDNAGNVLSVTETHEKNILCPPPGERDIGLFIFRKDVVFPLLKKHLPGCRSERTQEHGFLYIIGHVSRLGGRVQALPIATFQDTISFNSLADLDRLGASMFHPT